tara:strand:+ start:109 stop:1419 length:1311 start_codon:yes stop_codon:yes gene_type:complete
MKHLHIIFILFLISISQLDGKDSSDIEFKYSKIMAIPDLSFLDNVYSGLDILEQMDFKPLKNKSIAILTNQTALNRNGKHLLDLLKEKKDINVPFILSMEHGLWGIDDNRAKMIGRNQIEPVQGAQIIDMHTTYLTPPNWVMNKIDIILVDFQDTGSRYTTYLATLSKVFESAHDYSVPVIILDRPNPIRGDIVDGPIPRTEFQSFESYHLLPIRHGLTLAEICLIVNEMGWIKDLKRVELNIVPMSGWKREMWFGETKLVWRNLTPSLLNEINLLAYNGMDLFRGTNMNIGFGTKTPYMIIGAPWLSTPFIVEKLNKQNLPGVLFKAINYRPSGSIYHARVPRYDGQSCSGIKIMIQDRNLFKPIATATTILILIQQLHPREFQWEKNDYIDKLFGTNDLRIIAAQKKPPDHLPPLWLQDVYKFNEFRKPFLLYQ